MQENKLEVTEAVSLVRNGSKKIVLHQVSLIKDLLSIPQIGGKQSKKFEIGLLSLDLAITALKLAA